MAIERVTSTGTVIDAVISPDGKYVAYNVSDGGAQGLWLRQLATASTLELVPAAPSVGYWGISFTPDNNAVTCGMSAAAGPGGAFYRVPVLGGTPRKLLNGIDTPAMYSPDGRRFAYMRAAFPTPDSSALMVENNADGSGRRKPIATRRARAGCFAPMFFSAPAWSPDGSLIVAPVEIRGDRPRARLIAVRSADGAEQPFPAHEFDSIGQVTWMPDGRGLVVAGDRGASLPGLAQITGRQLWVDHASTADRPITSDLFDYRRVSLTDDSQTLVTVATDVSAGIWVAAIDGSREPKRVSSGKFDGINDISRTAGDGRTLYPVGRGRPFRHLEHGRGRRQAAAADD